LNATYFRYQVRTAVTWRIVSELVRRHGSECGLTIVVNTGSRARNRQRARREQRQNNEYLDRSQSQRKFNTLLMISFAGLGHRQPGTTDRRTGGKHSQRHRHWSEGNASS
jgi:hypothetical protein